MNTNTKISELFNYSTKNNTANWRQIFEDQNCGYLGKKCIKVRKSSPDISNRLSTNGEGIATAMGLKAEAKIELELILKSLESKLSNTTLFTM